MIESENNAGASARREYEKRVANREERVLNRFPRIGKYLLAILPLENSTTAWSKGATGEEKIGEFLNNYCAKNDSIVLHDLAIPGSRANIDHILITNFGVFVIDSKNYQGMIEIRDKGDFINGYREELYVGGRRQQNLISGMHKQLTVLKKFLGDEIPLNGILAFYQGEFPVFFKPRKIDGIFINSKGIVHILENFDKNQAVNVRETSQLIKSNLKSKKK